MVMKQEDKSDYGGHMKDKKHQITQPDKLTKRFLNMAQCISTDGFWPDYLEGHKIENQPANRDQSQNRRDKSTDF